MSGMLNSGMDGNAQLLQMLQMQSRDPFQKPMPGENLLGAGGMAMPPQMQQGQPQQSMQPRMEQMGQQMSQPGQQMSQPGQQMPGMEQAPEGGAMPPQLPNFPKDMGGFGLGQFAPKDYQPVGLRQQLIQMLMAQLGGGMGGGL